MPVFLFDSLLCRLLSFHVRVFVFLYNFVCLVRFRAKICVHDCGQFDLVDPQSAVKKKLEEEEAVEVDITSIDDELGNRYVCVRAC